jgi:hypothetical protein
MSYQYRTTGKKPVGIFRRVFLLKPGDFFKMPLGKNVYQVQAILTGFRFEILVKTYDGQKRTFRLSPMKRLQVVPRF